MSTDDLSTAEFMPATSLPIDEFKMILLDRFQDLPAKHIENYSSGLLLALRSILKEADPNPAIREVCDHLRGRRDFAYVNQACEFTLAYHFVRSHPAHFTYQVDTLTLGSPPARSRRSFDFRFRSEITSFNVEVKCFARDHQPSADSLPVKTFFPQEQNHALYDAGLRSEGTCRKTLLSFLDKANVQLPARESGMNVVAVCCNDVEEYADALECLAGNFGIVRDDDVLVRYPNIDAVVLTLTGLPHLSAIDPDALSRILQQEGALPPEEFEFWDYAQTLPLGVFLSKDRGGDIKDDFKQVFRLQNDRLAIYRASAPGDLQGAVFALFNATLGSFLSMTPVE